MTDDVMTVTQVISEILVDLVLVHCYLFLGRYIIIYLLYIFGLEVDNGVP